MARISAGHPWRTLGLWVGVIIVAGVLTAGMGELGVDGGEFTNSPESERAATLIEERLEGTSPLTETVVIQSQTTTVDDPAFQAVVERTTNALLGMPDIVASAANYYQAQAAGAPEAETMVSVDRRTTIIPVTLFGNYADLLPEGAAYLEAAQGEAGDGFAVYAVGDLSIAEVFNTIAEEDMSKDLSIGLPVAAVVLIVVFGALVAAGVPLLLGMVSIFVATGLTAILARVVTITSDVQAMITMIGLAVGIDYALFIVERYREERRHGFATHDAIALAGGTAGKAVLFSGSTVVLALMGMFLIPVSIFHSLAAGAILAVVVAMIATQTLVPAIISLLGDKIDWPRRRRYDAVTVATRSRYDHETIHAGFWGRITSVVMARPVMAVVLAVGLLLAAAVPVLDLETGQSSFDSLPDSSVKRGYQILDQEFYAGDIAPVRIVIDSEIADSTVSDGVDRIVAALNEDALYGAVTIESNDAGDLTRLSAPMAADPNSTVAYDAIKTLRAELVPAAFGPVADDVYVGGSSALAVDFNTALTEYAPMVYVFVLGMSFLLLMMAFRSLIVPVKAILMNLLSVAAAYGLVVLVLQKGVGADLLGLTQVETIGAWLPVFLFCILFGLSMDYHVFLLSRIREHFDLTGRNDESVAVGLQATAKIITGAALIMVAVFGAFASGRIAEMQQMGFGLAVAVFLDATIVRSVLVPATMKLLGDRNWYLPAWLQWLPDLRIEGTPAATAPPMAVPTPSLPLAEPAIGD